MERLKLIIDILKSINNTFGRIAFIVTFLIAVGIALFFSTGCAYKYHADKIDNVTREFHFNGGSK